MTCDTFYGICVNNSVYNTNNDSIEEMNYNKYNLNEILPIVGVMGGLIIIGSIGIFYRMYRFKSKPEKNENKV